MTEEVLATPIPIVPSLSRLTQNEIPRPPISLATARGPGCRLATRNNGSLGKRMPCAKGSPFTSAGEGVRHRHGTRREKLAGRGGGVVGGLTNRLLGHLPRTTEVPRKHAPLDSLLRSFILSPPQVRLLVSVGSVGSRHRQASQLGTDVPDNVRKLNK